MLPNSYKFRAECLADIIELQQILEGKYIITTLSAEDCDEAIAPIPDLFVTLITDSSFQDIIRAMKNSSESDVMLQTIEESENFTGQRNFKRRHYSPYKR